MSVIVKEGNVVFIDAALKRKPMIFVFNVKHFLVVNLKDLPKPG